MSIRVEPTCSYSDLTFVHIIAVTGSFATAKPIKILTWRLYPFANRLRTLAATSGANVFTISVLSRSINAVFGSTMSVRLDLIKGVEIETTIAIPTRPPRIRNCEVAAEPTAE
jgi:hypothetical protein